MAQAETLLQAGTLLQGRYRIVAAIGRGGMGAVYEARDERLRSPVAVKELLGSGPELRRAFAREAQLLANLKHTALPRVIDHFQDEVGQFLVMEFIPGPDLAALLKAHLKDDQGPFPPEQVYEWADQLLAALEYLHGQQPPVIHRDIKPQNVKVTPQGQLMLLDFGLAKGLPAATTTSTSRQSLYGYTLFYAPFEQIRGAGTDARSDLYAVGATLYMLLTGRDEPNALERAEEAMSRRPDPLLPARTCNPRVSPALDAVLLQAMALDRADRPASATALRRMFQTARGVQTMTTSGGGTAPGPHPMPPHGAHETPPAPEASARAPLPPTSESTTGGTGVSLKAVVGMVGWAVGIATVLAVIIFGPYDAYLDDYVHPMDTIAWLIDKVIHLLIAFSIIPIGLAAFGYIGTKTTRYMRSTWLAAMASGLCGLFVSLYILWVERVAYAPYHSRGIFELGASNWGNPHGISDYTSPALLFGLVIFAASAGVLGSRWAKERITVSSNKHG